MALEAIRFDPQLVELQILDQRVVPFSERFVSIKTAQEGHDAIKDMLVRGAPAIAIVGALSVAVDVWHTKGLETMSGLDVVGLVNKQLDLVVSARPTAVNVGNMARDVKTQLQRMVSITATSSESDSQSSTTSSQVSGKQVAETLVQLASAMMVEDVESNKHIGELGARWLAHQLNTPDVGSISVATICNTGSLATAGYGTALGIIRSLHAHKVLDRAFCLETRPYNQGARLTAFELVHDKIPATLITDSMAAALFKLHPTVRAVIVGADRVANNGDTVNKIGTYQLAVLAKHHGLKFIVAAPTTSIDTTVKCGEDITIEERPADELCQVKGAPLDAEGHVVVSSKSDDNESLEVDGVPVAQTINIQVAALGIDVWNPSFDVTPNDLIDAIVTEKAVVERHPETGFNLSEIVSRAEQVE